MTVQRRPSGGGGMSWRDGQDQTQCMPLLNLSKKPDAVQSNEAVQPHASAPMRPPMSEQDWRALVERYAGALRYTVHRRVPLDCDVEDVVQQALLQAVVGWPTFRGEAMVSTWVFGIAHNLARNHVSRAKALVQFGLDEAVSIAPCTAPDPCEHLVQQETLRCLQQRLRDLPETQTEALWLVEVDGLSYDEAAAALGVSVAAIKHRVARARASLRAGWA